MLRPLPNLIFRKLRLVSVLHLLAATALCCTLGPRACLAVPQVDESARAAEVVGAAEVAAAADLAVPEQADEVETDAVLEQSYRRAMVIEVAGPIFGRFHWFLNQRLDLAKQQSADLIIIKLTSPGGDLEHSLQLARRLREIDWATTIVFIPEEAISGGAIIALGADRIYMQQSALIGDAGPIRLGMDGQFRHAEEKIVSYTASAIAELAAAGDRPPALAEAMADRSLVVYQATDRKSGETVYLKESQLDDAQVQAKYEIGRAVEESGQNRFLTLGAERALELGLCEGVFQSQASLLGRLDMDDLQATQMTWVDQTVFLLNRTWFSALLLIVGLIGLYLELAAPGISVAGLTSLCCFSLFFWSHFLGGTAGWLEVLLFFLGVTCLIFELFVIPGFGVFGISGLLLLVFSLVMASQDFVFPESAAQWSQLQSNLLVVLGSVLGVMVLLVGQLLLLDSLPGLDRFRLGTPNSNAGDGQSGDPYDQTTVSVSQLTQHSAIELAPLSIGDIGTADSDLRPSGKVRFVERLVDVVTEGDYVDSGTPVEIMRLEGNRVVVRKKGDV